MGHDILVIAEQLQGQFDDVTYELLGKGRELADAGGGKLSVAVLGSGIDTSSLGAADRVLLVDDASLAEFNPEAYVATLATLIEPGITLVANTSMGMDLAAALSVRCDKPLVAYATDVALDGDHVVATSMLYGGKIYAESVIEGDGIVGVLAGSFPADAGKKDGSPAVENRDAAPTDSRLRFTGLIQPEGGDVDITQHDVLVAVGRGIQSEDNIALAEALAKAAGGAVCSSRPIVDNKWLPKTRQVGKSGMKVKPKVYLMLGISGAPEHMEGIKDAGLVIAVNTDETAPIFEHAHYGTTEDLFDIIPVLTEKLA